MRIAAIIAAVMVQTVVVFAVGLWIGAMLERREIQAEFVLTPRIDP